jgi:N12 class adenine-specific DNA methylase
MPSPTPQWGCNILECDRIAASNKHYGFSNMSYLNGSAFLDFLFSTQSVESAQVIPQNKTIIARTISEKINNNIAALQVVKNCIAEGRNSTTEDEQAVLGAYAGWGQLSSIFDNKHPRYLELKGLLTPKEHSALAASILTSYYTPEWLIDCMYRAVARLGVQEGCMLDPATGSGRFLSRRPACLAAMRQFAVELDGLTGNIARLNNPHAKVYVNQPFESVKLPNGGDFSLVIGNPPYSSVNAKDRTFGPLSLHNYFMIRGLMELHVGGLMAYVVSSWVMDAKDPTLRQELASRGNLVAACRLPNSVFGGEGANVVTDILVFQAAAHPEENPVWIDTVDLMGDNVQSYAVNRLFVENPELVAGTLSAPSNFNLTCECTTSEKGEHLAHVVNAILDQQTQNPVFYRKSSTLAARRGRVAEPAGVDDVGVYEFCIADDSEILRRLPDVLDTNGHPEKVFESVVLSSLRDKTRLIAMLRVKGVLARLIRAEQEDQTTPVIQNFRANLNATYDLFVKDFGPFHATKNRSVLSEDPWYYRLRALEVDYTAPISKAVAEKEGVQEQAAKWSKSEFFTRRIIKPVVEPTCAETIEDAVQISVSYRGCVDVEFVGRLIGSTADRASLIRTMAEQSLAFEDPTSGAIIQAAKYLSGLLPPRIEEAKAAAQDNPAFELNVTALEQALPAPIKAIDIFVPINARWIPVSFHEEFIRHLAQDPSLSVTVVLADDAFQLRVGSISAIKNSVEWGTTRRGMAQLVSSLFNNAKIEVKDPHPVHKDTYVINHEETLAAQHKADEIRAAWELWVLDDAARRELIQERYNEKFNGFVTPKYDGSRLPLTGCALDLYSSQRNAVARGIFESTMLADHCVGAGKTNFMIALAHELRRINPGERLILVAPNHLISQHAAAAQFLFPGMNIIVLDKKQMEPATRRTALARLAISDFDLCIIPLSVFGLIPAPVEAQMVLINREIESMAQSLRALESAKFGVREIQKRMQKKQDQLECLASRNRDDYLDFASLRITGLIIDESQFAKNLAYSTSLTNVAGLGDPAGSQRAFDLYVKSRCVLWNGGRYIEATGTPILNSVVEAHRHIRFLAEDYAESAGLDHFDAFSSVFAQPITSYELAASGSGYKQRTRVGTFTNITELQAIYSSFADVVTENELPSIIPRLPDGRSAIPPLSGGKITELVIDPDAAQESGFKQIVLDFENVGRHGNNPLALLHRGRMLSLDARLVDSCAPDHATNKVNTVARNIFARYQATNDVQGTQLVFLDRSIPARHRAGAQKDWGALVARADAGDDSAAQQIAGINLDEMDAMLRDSFSLYDELVSKLVSLGIPENEIAVIHDYKTDIRKEWLRTEINNGRIRVLLGSTELMGSGSNYNRKLVALIDFDLPLRPGDLTQRHGRILRQGNDLWIANPNFAVEIVVPITRRSMDAWQLGLLNTKQRFITLFRQLDCSVRHYTEQNEVIDFGELSAIVSGDPRILEHVRGTAALRKLEAAKNSWFRGRMMMQDSMSHLQGCIDSLDAKMPQAIVDADTVTNTDDRLIMINGLQYGLSQDETPDSATDGKSSNAYAALNQEWANGTYSSRGACCMAEYRGLKLMFSRQGTMFISEYDCFHVRGAASSYSLTSSIKTLSVAGVLNAFIRFVDAMPAMPEHMACLKAKHQQEIQEMEREIQKPFAKQAELDDLIARLRELERALLETKSSNTSQPESIEQAA